MVVTPSFWNGRRVLVTGHTGFKGSWLALWLVSMGAEVTGLSHRVPTEPSLFVLARLADHVRDIRADVRDDRVVARVVAEVRPEIVLHLAAQSLVRTSFLAPRETYEVNVMGTVNVLEAVRVVRGVRAVVNVTSDKCYQNREWEWAYRENEPIGGNDPYSSSKGAAELVTSAWRHSYFRDPDGPRLASARAGNVIGGGDWGPDRLVPDVIRAALDARAVDVRNPGATRPWQHVLNPLDGYLLLAQRLYEDPAAAVAWNFGPREYDARPVAWLIERLQDLWPEPLQWEHDLRDHPPEAGFLNLDSSLARARLGWRPTWELDRALESIVEWYVAFRDGEDMRAISLAQLEGFVSDKTARAR